MKRRKNSNAKLEVEGVSEDASSDEEKTFVIDTKGQTQIFRLKYLMILKRAIADIFPKQRRGANAKSRDKGFYFKQKMKILEGETNFYLS